MSDSTSVTAVGPSYWTFMATVMSARLDRFISSREVTPSDIPEGVYQGAKEFFELVRGDTDGSRPKYLPAHINAYVIATDALRASLGPSPQSNQDLLAKLDRYAEFVDGLAEPHPLTEESEVKTAESLRDFFRSLAQDGEAELYMSTIQANHLPAGYTLV